MKDMPKKENYLFRRRLRYRLKVSAGLSLIALVSSLALEELGFNQLKIGASMSAYVPGEPEVSPARRLIQTISLAPFSIKDIVVPSYLVHWLFFSVLAIAAFLALDLYLENRRRHFKEVSEDDLSLY